jgi:hypothetical protein
MFNGDPEIIATVTIVTPNNNPARVAKSMFIYFISFLILILFKASTLMKKRLEVF